MTAGQVAGESGLSREFLAEHLEQVDALPADTVARPRRHGVKNPADAS